MRLTAASMLIVAVALLAPFTKNATSSATKAFTAVADTYADSSHPDANYGSDTAIQLDGSTASDGSPISKGFLRFDLAGLSGTIVSAHLRVYVVDGVDSFTVHTVASNSWDESTLTWSNAPAVGTSLASSGAGGGGTWVSFDVTSAIQSDGSVSFALDTPDPSLITVASRESGSSTAPQLVVQTDATAPASTTPPTISGQPVVGQTLTAGPGTWSGTTPMSFAYQWLRCDSGGSNCALIPGATSATYPATTADVGSTVQVSVTATNDVGSSTATSATTGAVTAATGAADATPPSVPTDLVETSSTDTTITVGWTASTDDVGVVGYHTYRDGTKTYTTATTSHTFSYHLTCGTSYALGVDAFDAAGNVSAQATIVGSTSPCPTTTGSTDTTPPSVPDGLSVVGVSESTLSLMWNPSSDDVGVAGYDVFDGSTKVGTTAATSFAVGGLSCGTSHSISVVAFDGAGNRSSAASLTAATTACSSFTTLSLTPVADAQVREADPFTNYGTSTSLRSDGGGDPDVRSFLRFSVSGVDPSQTVQSAMLRLYVPSDGTVDGPSLFSVADDSWLETTIDWTNQPLGASVATDDVGAVPGGSWMSYDVTPLVQGNGTYSFEIGATPTSDGTNYNSREASSSRPQLLLNLTDGSGSATDTTAPSAPSALTVGSVSASSITLGWTTSTDNVGVSGYDVYLNGSKNATTSSDGFTFTNLSCGTSYTLAVDAYDAAGNVSPQTAITAATDACPAVDSTPPSMPGGLAVAAVSETSITLTWLPSTDDVAVAGYDTYRNGTRSGTSLMTSAVFSNLSCGSSYTLGVDAFDAAGNRSAIASMVSSTAPCSSSGPCGTSLVTPSYQHVVWIVFENHSYSQIIGSSSAPFFNQLADDCGLATNFYAETHPSLPNYIAMTSGSTQGVSDDSGPSSHPLGVPNIFEQLGTNWHSLMESMPSNCAKSDSGDYVVHHNPAAYFTNLNGSCSSQDVPLDASPNLSSKFTLVVPNNCNNMHSCSIGTGDNWLKNFMPKIYATSQWQAGDTVVFITFDEDNNTSTNKIATIVVSPSTVPGTRSSTTFTHYSLLRTSEQLLGLTPIGNAATAASMLTPFGL